MVVVVGTDADPQNLDSQVEQFRSAGAGVYRSLSAAIQYVAQRVSRKPEPRLPEVSLDRFADAAGLHQRRTRVFLRKSEEPGSGGRSGGLAPPGRRQRAACGSPGEDEKMSIDIEQANATAVERMMSARPMLTGVRQARDVIPGMKPNTTPACRAAHRVGAHVRPTARRADRRHAVREAGQDRRRKPSAMAERGEVEFEPCHHHGAVGPMAGVISASMKVYVVENVEHGNKAFSNLNEGYGKVLRYGAYSEEVLSAPALDERCARARAGRGACA